MRRPSCPECVAGKHQNCDGTAWDDERDDITECGCNLDWHPTTTKGGA